MVTNRRNLDPWRRWAADTADETGVRQLTTLSGWRRFVLDDAVPPDLPPAPPADATHRRTYDEARVATTHAWS